MNDDEKSKRNLLKESGERHQRIRALARKIDPPPKKEDGLSNSEERYRRLVELSPDMIIVLSKGNIVYMNPAGIKILGASEAEELIGKPFLEIIHPDYLEIAKERIRRVEEGQEVPLLEEKYIRLDGNSVYVEVAAAPIPYEGQTMIQVVARDITERKRLEAAAQRLARENAIIAEIGQIINSTLTIEDVYGRFAEYVRKLIQFDRITINIINPEQNTFIISYAAGPIVAEQEVGRVIPLAGTGTEWITQTRSSLLVPERNRKEVVDRLPGLLPLFKAGFQSVMLTPLISKDQVNGVLSLQASKENAYTEMDVKVAERVGTQIAGAIANAQLFLERGQAEESLRQAEEKYRTILGTIEEGYYEVDLAGNFTFINDSLCRMLGYAKGELLGMNNRQYMDQENAKKVFKAFNQVYRTGEPYKWLDWKIVRKDGTKKFHESSISLRRNSQGESIGFRGIVRDISERKQAAEVLREAEERYRLLFEISTNAVLIRDREGVIRLANPTAIKMLEASRPQEIIGKAYLDFVHPEDRPGSIDRIQRQIEAAQGETGIDPGDIVAPLREHRLRTLNGGTIYVESTGVAFRDQGQVWIQGNFHDISKRKQAEEALRKGEEVARRMAHENAIVAEIGRIVSSTLHIEEVYEGFAKEANRLIPFDRISVNLINSDLGTVTIAYVSGWDIEGRRVGDVFPLQDSVNEEIRRTRKGLRIQPEAIEELGGPFPSLISTFRAGLRSMMSVPLLYRDQVIGILHFRSKKSKAYSGQDLRLAERIAAQIAGAIANAQLFAERKRAEEALQASEEKYRLLVQNSNDAIFVAQDDVIKFPNLKTEELVGYPASELTKIPFVNHIHPDDREMVFEKHEKRLEGQKFSSTYSFRIRNKAGEELWVEINTVVILWEGRPATLNFMRDITEKKKLEAQFFQAQKMEAVGTLAGGIAHDFNNLLMGIQGHTSLMLLDMDSSHPHYKMLKSTEEQVKSGADLTWQLLSFARGGKYEVKPTDLNAIIKKTSTLFGRTKKEISIQRSPQQDLWPVEVDRGQIEQVLLNLYVNAWQAMPNGGTLSLETKNVMLGEDYVKPFYVRPGNYAKISVTDTGVGMDHKTQQRIFDPFFTTKEMGRGTGLGLATVYGIIKSHGGVINVYSEKGHGATFNIYLPASEKKVEKEKRPQENLLQGKETILLVDDEEVVINVNRMVLERLGYKVFMAKSGQEAIEIYQNNKDGIDLVILDMIMPGMEGGKTFDFLKSINPDLKVILSSGYSINEEVARIIERGCQAFIQKPFSMGDLSQKIREVLDNKKDETEPDNSLHAHSHL